MGEHEPQFTDYDAQAFCGALELYLRQNPGKALKILTGDGRVRRLKDHGGKEKRGGSQGMSERKCFLCDINKNDRCRKTGCVINGGECYCTTDPAMAVTDKAGKPIVSPPGRKFDIAILDEEDRRHAMNLVYAIRLAQEEDV